VRSNNFWLFLAKNFVIKVIGMVLVILWVNVIFWLKVVYGIIVVFGINGRKIFTSK
jgi:hypothetical protein